MSPHRHCSRSTRFLGEARASASASKSRRGLNHQIDPSLHQCLKQSFSLNSAYSSSAMPPNLKAQIFSYSLDPCKRKFLGQTFSVNAFFFEGLLQDSCDTPQFQWGVLSSHALMWRGGPIYILGPAAKRLDLPWGWTPAKIKSPVHRQ